jgi:hypothetical protein
MIDWIMHPAHLRNSQFFYMEYLTLLMFFVIGDYNHISVVKLSLR